MQYYSTSEKSPDATLSQAIVHCVAPDGGLYMPRTWPVVPKAFFNNIDQLSLLDIAYVVANQLLGDDVDGAVLKTIVADSMNFRIPLVRLSENIFALELFHGPTLSFKDVGTRFLARLYRHLASSSSGRHINVLVATTGNSGSAIASAFKGLEGVDVFILYPRGRLSRMQEAQFATIGENTHPIEVRGSIDDCNRLVDTALLDSELNAMFHLTSANSLNLGRVLPQIVYFFEACARLKAAGIEPSETDFAMPCGNLSNVTAAAMARRMGAPIGSITGACTPGVFADMAGDGVSGPPLGPTGSSPANMPRLLALYGGDADALRREVHAEVFTTQAQEDAVREVYSALGYVAEPRSASAVSALLRRIRPGRHGVALINTHPAKALDRMTAITGRAIELPLQFTRFMARTVVKDKIDPTLPALRKILLRHNQQ
ncbi:MAG: pyridoxal-phosphate dependent enzyme [Muribaculaceae bacterium]|nr:pyridoxal-phosphate dependent enzyme [Muribaculaceae bacterium]